MILILLNFLEMRKTLFFFIILLALPLATFAQHNHARCGMNQEMIDLVNERLQRNKEAYLNNPVQFRDVVYIPIKFHLVARNDGSGRVNIGKVLDQLCALNEDFAPLDIQFYFRILRVSQDSTLELGGKTQQP